MLTLREAIFTVAAEQSITDIDETLKWGEPSYIAKSGSTIRIDWKSSTPDYYGLYFNCNSKLVATFRELYPNHFHYQGNRALMIKIGQKIDLTAVKHCITLALRYHKIKHLPLLGA